MISSYNFIVLIIRFSALVVLFYVLFGWRQSFAQDTYQNIQINLDKTTGAKFVQKKGATSSLTDLEKNFSEIDKKPDIYLDLKIVLGNNKKYEILTSSGENRRFVVDCRPEVYGRLEMRLETEYYIKSEAKSNRIDLAIFPGLRTEHIYNDVACVKEQDNAIFRVRGFFAAIVNHYDNVSVVQLRPLVPRHDVVKKYRRGQSE